MSMSSFRRYHHHNRGGGGSSTSNNNSTNDNQSRGQQQRNNNNSTSSTGNSGGGSNNRHHNSYRFGRSWSSRTNRSHTNHNNNNNNHRNGSVNNNRRGIMSPNRRATSMREMKQTTGVESDSFLSVDGDTTSTSSNSTCVICMEELKGRLGVANPCGHVFHQECYGTWDIQSFGTTNDSSDDDDDDDSSNDDFRRHPTKCPTCRRSISVFTHIHELVGQIQFGEIIPPCLQTTTPTATQNVDSNNNGNNTSNANRVSPNSSYELSSFIRRNLNDVRGFSTSSLDDNEGRASFGVVGDMEVDSLCAEVSDLRSQVASLESILKSSEEQREATAQKVHTDQEHLARGMIDLSESNEQLRTQLRKMEGLYESLQIENRRLQDEIEEGKVIMNDLFASKTSSDNHNNMDGDHYGDYHGMHRHSFT